MKSQWSILAALIVALIIAIFSVINVELVKVHFVFGTAEWPLILVILVSAVLGALLVGVIGLLRVYRLQRELKNTKAELAEFRNKETLNEDPPVEAEEEPTRMSRLKKQ